MRFTIEGLDCANCAAKLERELRKVPGCEEATVNFTAKVLDAPLEKLEDIRAVVNRVEPGATLIMPESRALKKYTLNGLDCAACAAKLEAALQQVPGLGDARVNFTLKMLEMPAGFENQARQVIARVEPDVKLVEAARESAMEHKSAGRSPHVILTSIILLALGAVLHWQGTPYKVLEYGVLVSSYLLVGWPIVYKAGRNIIRGQVFDENFLMTVASFGAIAIGEVPEAAAVMVFYAVGEYFQERAVNNSRKSIAALLNIRPEYANLVTSSGESKVAPEDVQVGQLIMVKPGERVPLDGVVREGTSLLDTSALTGESVPRRVRRGGAILAGMVNREGLLSVEVTKIYADSSVARILELVERASERKAPAERFITSFARYYTPAVVIGAVLLAVVPPLVLPGATFSTWVYRALVMLVISCPCALVVSVPLSYFGGIGAASKHGVLFKGANYLDAVAKMHTVVFDKTGTLTHGVFKVTTVEPRGTIEGRDLLALAASVEQHSNHPLARSICQAVNGQGKLQSVSDVRELAGRGMEARLGELEVLVGNSRLMQERGVTVEEPLQLGTAVHVALEGEWLGYIVVADEIKSDSAEAVSGLKELGAARVWMLTGDREQAALTVATSLGLDGYAAELLPEDKVREVEKLQAGLTARKEVLLFVGDGINDAPVIARADVGVAMGGLGSDAAIEAADVVIMQDSPARLLTAVEIARFTSAIVRQNVWLSLGVKAGFMALGVLGITTIWGAVFADVGVALIAVLNATRALRYKASLVRSSSPSPQSATVSAE